MAIRLVFNPQTGWKGSAKSEPISFRELTILTMIANGDSYEKISGILGVKHQTVKNNVYRLTKKLGAKNNVHALMLAMEARMITIEWISDDMDESLPKERRDEARLDIMQEIDKVSG